MLAQLGGVGPQRSQQIRRGGEQVSIALDHLRRSHVADHGRDRAAVAGRNDVPVAEHIRPFGPVWPREVLDGLAGRRMQHRLKHEPWLTLGALFGLGHLRPPHRKPHLNYQLGTYVNTNTVLLSYRENFPLSGTFVLLTQPMIV